MICLSFNKKDLNIVTFNNDYCKGETVHDKVTTDNFNTRGFEKAV